MPETLFLERIGSWQLPSGVGSGGESEDRERDELSVPTKTDVPDFYYMSDAVGPAEVRDVYPNAELVEVWGNARDILEDQFKGKAPKVAVYPSSAISYPVSS